MELVPIITQVLTIVASIFVLVLLISFIASKVRKKEKEQNIYNNSYGKGVYTTAKVKTDKGRYYGGSYNSVNSVNYPKEIKVVKRTGPPKTYSINSSYRTNSYYKNNRFTVINNIDPVKPSAIETDEFGFKVYADNEITRSFYLPN